MKHIIKHSETMIRDSTSSWKLEISTKNPTKPKSMEHHHDSTSMNPLLPTFFKASSCQVPPAHPQRFPPARSLVAIDDLQQWPPRTTATTTTNNNNSGLKYREGAASLQVLLGSAQPYQLSNEINIKRFSSVFVCLHHCTLYLDLD